MAKQPSANVRAPRRRRTGSAASPPRLTGAPRSAASIDRILLDHPERFLGSLPAPGGVCDLGRARFVEMWGLVALAALARTGSSPVLRVRYDGSGEGAGFARAVGFEDVVAGRPSHRPGERGRTVTLRRFATHDKVEPTAHEIANLVLPRPEDQESRRVVQYVIVELLRNVVQHSQDPLGGVVAAQRMDEQQKAATPCVQIAVADAGLGVPATMRGLHPEAADPAAALNKALLPHISGRFEEGLTGDGVNAGMGLFFIHEMAKLAVGRLLLASRGAGLLVQGNARDVDRPALRLLAPPGSGFPGTLVAFELPLGRVADYSGLITAIHERARARTPQRAVHRWIRWEAGRPGAARFLVRRVAEDTAAAETFVAQQLVPRLIRRKPVVLDFAGLEICTQSFLHALLFRAIRLAWAEHVEIHVANATGAVRSGIEALEDYALGG
jgi:anti-sigma regulatory factor (Ser/Thr protein kinase)